MSRGGRGPVDWSRPTPEGEREVAAVHGRLRDAGVPAGPAGYDLAALEIAAALLGWVSDAGPSTAGDPGPCIAAVALRDGLEEVAHVGWGWSEAVALARALDRALAP